MADFYFACRVRVDINRYPSAEALLDRWLEEAEAAEGAEQAGPHPDGVEGCERTCGLSGITDRGRRCTSGPRQRSGSVQGITNGTGRRSVGSSMSLRFARMPSGGSSCASVSRNLIHNDSLCPSP